MSEAKNDLTMPVGPGGMAGRIFRFVIMAASGGFIFPNVCVEGMNLTAIQAGQAGTLYDGDKEKK